jgi:hypothetical protein
LLVALTLLPSPIAAPLLGESQYFASILKVACWTGLLYLARSILHWVRWSWRIHKRLAGGESIEPAKIDALSRWMGVETLLALFWVLGATLLRSPAAVGAVMVIPVPILFLCLLAAVAFLPTGVASHKADELGLLSTTDAIRRGRIGAILRIGSDPFVELPIYGGLRKVLDLPNRPVGAGLLLVGMITVLLSQGITGYAGAEAVHAFEQRILHVPAAVEQSTAGAKAEAQTTTIAKPISAPPPNCQGKPGSPAPRRWADKLYELWYGGTRTNGFGSVVAGCPLPARPEPGRTNLWIERGACHGRLQSLGVAPLDGNAVMLLQQAARVGDGLAREGVLRSATRRKRVGEGDFYLLQTSRGSYLLVRPRRSGGPTAEDETTIEACGSYEDRNVSYSVAPPGLIGALLEIDRQNWVWPVEEKSEGDLAADFVLVDDRTHRDVGRAHCVSALSCEVSYRGNSLPSSGSASVGIAELLALAPPPL